MAVARDALVDDDNNASGREGCRRMGFDGGYTFVVDDGRRD
jgi:hypothetical protein